MLTVDEQFEAIVVGDVRADKMSPYREPEPDKGTPAEEKPQEAAPAEEKSDENK
ncbi:hypothetical protein DFP74_2105 [Nocardiopsis sp. Huas11]|nr:hypothetical protein DFP74_2105 [Nocardiopsis sp. Huas11]